MTITSITLYIFGTTAGLEVKRITGFPDIEVLFNDKWLEPRLGTVQLVNDSPFYLIERRVISNQLSTWIGGYWPAREIGTSRPGGHAGAGLLLCGCSVDSDLAVRLINALYTDMATQAISGGEFTKRISNLGLSKPIDLDNLLISKKDLPFIAPPNNSQITVVFSSTSELSEALRWAQSDGCSVFFPSIVLGYSCNFNSGNDLDLPRHHYKNYAILLETTYKPLNDLLKAENKILLANYTTLQEDKVHIEKEFEKARRINADLKTRCQNLENDISAHSFNENQQKNKNAIQSLEWPNTDNNDELGIYLNFILYLIGILILSVTCYFFIKSDYFDSLAFWRPPPQPIKNETAALPKLNEFGRSPSDLYGVNGEILNEPSSSWSLSCYSDQELVSVRYDRKLGVGDTSIKDQISTQLKEDCPEFTKPVCASKLKEIIDPIVGKNVDFKIPAVCLINAIKNQRVYFSISEYRKK